MYCVWAACLCRPRPPQQRHKKKKMKSRQSGFKPSPFTRPPAIHSSSFQFSLSPRHSPTTLPLLLSLPHYDLSFTLYLLFFLSAHSFSTACVKLPRKILHNQTFITFCLFFKLQIEPDLLTYMLLLSVRDNSRRYWVFISELMSFIFLCWRG